MLYLFMCLSPCTTTNLSHLFVLIVSSTYGRVEYELEKGLVLNESKFGNLNRKCTWEDFRASYERTDAQ